MVPVCEELDALMHRMFSLKDRRKIKTIYEQLYASSNTNDTPNLIMQAILIAVRMDGGLRARMEDNIEAMKALQNKNLHTQPHS